MSVYWLRYSKRGYLKLIHIHTGFNDYCLFWWSYGRLMDVLFIRISSRRIQTACDNKPACPILICAAKRSCEILGECVFNHELANGSFDELMKDGRKGVAANILPIFQRKRPFKYQLPKQYRVKQKFTRRIKRALAKPSKETISVRPPKIYPQYLVKVYQKWLDEPDPNFHEPE
jgi:hypothetical protein